MCWQDYVQYTMQKLHRTLHTDGATRTNRNYNPFYRYVCNPIWSMMKSRLRRFANTTNWTKFSE